MEDYQFTTAIGVYTTMYVVHTTVLECILNLPGKVGILSAKVPQVKFPWYDSRDISLDLGTSVLTM